MFHKTLSLFLSALPLSVLAAENADVISTVTAEANVEKITIEGAATANDKPVGTFNSPISNLEYDPRVDLQSRNMAEAQADVTIRGGIFENTGFRVGSATLIDPQTGHYFAEIPIAPEMLTKPSIFTGVDNALYGVNSSVGTVSFGWKPIQKGGSVSIGAGNNNFNLQRVHGASTMLLESYPAWSVGIEGEYSRSESDGTIANGDHQFERMSGRVQLASERSQTDLFYGFQQKFFGWPNLYTPFNVNETEDIETRLVMLNHRQGYGEKGMENTVEVSAYYRENDDHYVFSRENPEAFQAFHETEVKSLALSGTHNLSQDFGINYSAQFTADDIKSTTLAIMNNALIPAGLVVNLLLWQKDTDFSRLFLGGAIIAFALWMSHQYSKKQQS
jgi:vitamin B12 transporter